MDVIQKAKAGLIVKHPFFAGILLTMDMIQDDTVKTMQTDGESIRYNSQWCAPMSQNEIEFVLAHETLHCVFQHMFTRGTRTPNRWNQAADYIINGLLHAEKLGVMPKGGLHDPQLVARGNGTTEGVYDLLPEDSEDKGAGSEGGAMDEVTDAGHDEASKTQKQQDMRIRLIQAKNAAKICGKMSAGLERLVAELTKPKVDWRSVLRRFFGQRSKEFPSYSRPKRRFLSQDLLLPSLIGEKLGKIAVAIDCSGSVDDQLIKIFGTEVTAIHEDMKPSQLEIIYFDSKVLRTREFGPEERVQLEACGGGGTAFSPIFEYLNACEVLPVACVVLTDLQCNDFGPCPDYPVLFCSTDAEAAPFGEVILIDQAEELRNAK